MAAGISGLAAIAGAFFIKGQFSLSAENGAKIAATQNDGHIEDVADDGIADRAVRRASKDGAGGDYHFWRARPEGNHRQARHQLRYAK